MAKKQRKTASTIEIKPIDVFQTMIDEIAEAVELMRPYRCATARRRYGRSVIKSDAGRILKRSQRRKRPRLKRCNQQPQSRKRSDVA
jgi:hypothetical protein